MAQTLGARSRLNGRLFGTGGVQHFRNRRRLDDGHINRRFDHRGCGKRDQCAGLIDADVQCVGGDAASAKTAGERIQAAMKAVRDAYRSLDPAA